MTGLGYLNLGQLEEFKYYQEQAIKVNPDATIAYINISKYYLDKNMVDEALAMLEKAQK